jgi:hypothetical protein
MFKIAHFGGKMYTKTTPKHEWCILAVIAFVIMCAAFSRCADLKGPSGTSLLANVSATATTYTDSTVADGVTYYYWTTAVAAPCPLSPPPGLVCGESVLSNLFAVTVPATGTHSVALTWTLSPATGIQSQNVYRAGPPGPTAGLGGVLN